MQKLSYSLSLFFLTLLSACSLYKDRLNAPISQKKQITSQDTYVKPKVLFHASSNKNIKILQPRAVGVRDETEGPLVFATPNLGLASIWLVRFYDDKSGSGCLSHKHFYYFHKDREEFMRKDKGGAIYVLPADSFYSVPNKGLGEYEWVSKEPVKPLCKLEFDSGLDAMIDLGVQVFFVNDDTFRKLSMQLSNKGKHLRDLFKELKSENEKRDKNILPCY